MEAAVQHNIKETFADLTGILSQFDQSQIDRIPFEGSWTAGQVGEHLTKGLSGMPELVAGKTEETRRRFDAKAQYLRDTFLDFNTKFKSPEFLEPTETVHSKEQLLEGFRKIEKELLDIVKKQDLTLTLLDFEMPQSGTLTTYEWLAFLSAHAQRHTHQLKNIYRHLNP